MALLLRNVNKAKWIRPAWAGPEDIPSDALVDLRSTDNALSVWMVRSPGIDDLRMALAALASNRQKLEKLDYSLIDEAALSSISIRLVKSEGRTPHISANSTHGDLVELTVNKVALLAAEMMPLKRERVTEKQVRQLLVDALRNGHLDRGRIDPGLLNELEANGADQGSQRGV